MNPVGNLAEQYRELGKELFWQEEDKEKKAKGLSYIVSAHRMKDPEAGFLLAELLLTGAVNAGEKDSRAEAMGILYSLAGRGFPAARAKVDEICSQRYRERMDAATPDEGDHPLLDFRGEEIKIKREGLLTPVDAVLTREEGENILTLSADVAFWILDDMPDPAAFKKAVLAGFMAWQGEYRVFNGQKVRVVVELTEGKKKFDRILVLAATESVVGTLQGFQKVTKSEKIEAQIKSKRSFAGIGRKKWSVTSRKLITFFSRDDMFTDYPEITAVAKHEFGHVIGLGDLYYEPGVYSGVEKGTYSDLDCYHISDRAFNLVMCDHHAPVSNNDIEMVLLAFRDNKGQSFQPDRNNPVPSEALGRGN